MLEDLFDRLANGGLDITIVELGTKKSSDPVIAESMNLMSQLIIQERIVRRLHGVYERHDYLDKAKQLKDWWATSCKPADDIIDLVAKEPENEVDREALDARLTELNDTLRPLITDLAKKLGAVAARHLIAVCETDIDDILGIPAV